MREATGVARQDLLITKGWHEVTACRNDQAMVDYLIAKEYSNSLKMIVLAFYCNDSMSHQRLTTVFNSLSPPGDLNEYEDGLLLAIVGTSSNVVYHRIMHGMVNLLPTTKNRKAADR